MAYIHHKIHYSKQCSNIQELTSEHLHTSTYVNSTLSRPPYIVTCILFLVVSCSCLVPLLSYCPVCWQSPVYNVPLTHLGRVMHICVTKLTIIGFDNGLSPGRCQANIWTNDGKLLIGPWGTFEVTKMHLKVSFAKWRPFCVSLSRMNCIFQHSSVVLQGDKLHSFVDVGILEYKPNDDWSFLF